MSASEIEPLSPELRSLLDEERTRVEATPELRKRLDARLGSALVATGGGLAAATLFGRIRRALSSWARPAQLIVAWAVGAATGAGIHAALAPRPVAQPAPVAREQTHPVELKPQPKLAPMPPGPVGQPVRSVPRAIAQPKPAPGSRSDDELDEERAQLEVARTALVRGHPADALDVLDGYAKRFPRGQLGEESEALRIQALVAAGHRDQAQTRAAEFRRRYPESFLLPSIEAALKPPP